MVYEASNKPFRYLKGKVPARYWATKKKLTGMLKIFNECLRKTMPNHKNINKFVHFKIVAGCVDYDEEIIDGKFFWINCEVDERLICKLTDPSMRGQLRIGASPINLYGGGVVSETKAKLAKKISQEEVACVNKSINE